MADRLVGSGTSTTLGAVGARLGQQPLDLGVPVAHPRGLDHVEVVVVAVGVAARTSSAAARRRPASRPSPVSGQGEEVSTSS